MHKPMAVIKNWSNAKKNKKLGIDTKFGVNPRGSLAKNILISKTSKLAIINHGFNFKDEANWYNDKRIPTEKDRNKKL